MTISSMANMHKVFLSYHDANDASYKERLLELNEEHRIFVDGSVDTGDIDETDLPDDRIREIIRDDYLADTTVTIVLVGAGTKGRKHVDWEIYSSMRDGALLHEGPARVGRRGPHFSGPSAGATLQG